jgi:hypothetical protein
MSPILCAFFSVFFSYGETLTIHPEDGDDGLVALEECAA